MLISIFLLVLIPFSSGETLKQDLKCSSTKLIYEGHYLQTLLNSFFKNCTSIKFLYLQQNKIDFIQNGAFKGLSNLTHIDLSFNNIKQLPSNIFSDTPNLQEVIFSRNNITYLPTKLFNNLLYLKKVNFELNDIQIINDNCFVNVPSLEVIDLRLNKLQSLQINIIDNYSNIKKLILYGNSWNCDVTRNFQICEFMHMYVSNFSKYDIFIKPICSSPEEIFGVSWERFLESNLPIFYSNVQDNTNADPVTVQCAVCSKTPILWQFKHYVESKLLRQLKSFVEPAGPFKNLTSQAISSSGKYYTHSKLIIHDFSYSDIGNYSCYTGSKPNFWNSNDGYLFINSTRTPFLNDPSVYTTSYKSSYSRRSNAGYYIGGIILAIISLCCRVFRCIACGSSMTDDTEPIAEEQARMA